MKMCAHSLPVVFLFLFCSPVLKENGPIELKMVGVEYMNDDPSEVDVLYGKVNCDPLQQIADDITEYFISQSKRF